MYCSNCGCKNQDNAAFCQNCGNKFSSHPSQIPTSQAQSDSTRTAFPGAGQFAPSTYPSNPSPTTFPKTPFPLEIPENAAKFNVWGPFAGYGAQRSHDGWLMDNKGEHARDLQEKIREKFNERMIPGATAVEKELIAKGLLVEKRPYFILSRKNISVALYISDFGTDLFVSIASYLKPPISNLRVLIVGIMAAFTVLTMIVFPAAIASQFSAFGSGLGGLVTLLCVLGPVAGVSSILLTVLFFYSGYKWLTDKDILAALRSKPNEFNEDDLMALEKTVEQTVRTSIDEIGLDSDDLKPVTSGNKSRLI